MLDLNYFLFIMQYYTYTHVHMYVNLKISKDVPHIPLIKECRKEKF